MNVFRVSFFMKLSQFLLQNFQYMCYDVTFWHIDRTPYHGVWQLWINNYGFLLAWLKVTVEVKPLSGNWNVWQNASWLASSVTVLLASTMYDQQVQGHRQAKESEVQTKAWIDWKHIWLGEGGGSVCKYRGLNRITYFNTCRLPGLH